MGSLESDKVKIFVTHKHNEEREVMSIIQTLESFGGNRLHFEYAEHMPAGEDLRSWIIKKVAESDLLLFLMTKPDQDWSWCIYEAGVFEKANDLDTTKRVILIHSSVAKVPNPLDKMKVVRADQKLLEQFVQQFFGTSELTGKEPLNPTFNKNPKLVESTAKEICRQFVAKKPRQESSQHCNNYIALLISDPDAIKEKELPDDTIVESNESSLAMFGLAAYDSEGGTKRTWGDLKRQLANAAGPLSHVESRWRDELVNALFHWNKSRIMPPVRAVFQAQNGQRYLPVLSRIDFKRDKSKRFHVDFVEQKSVPSFELTPPRFASLLSCLILGNRLEFEVCHRHLGDLELLNAEAEAIRQLHNQIGQNISNIEREGEFRKEGEVNENLAIDRLVWALQPNGEAEVVAEALKEQENIKKRLMDTQRPLDADALKKELEVLRELNQRVMVLASKRYAELLEKDFNPPGTSHQAEKANKAAKS